LTNNRLDHSLSARYRLNPASTRLPGEVDDFTPDQVRIRSPASGRIGAVAMLPEPMTLMVVMMRVPPSREGQFPAGALTSQAIAEATDS
jgi:hypothetical protein